MAQNWFQQQVRNIQSIVRRGVQPAANQIGTATRAASSAVQRVTRTGAAVAPVVARAGTERVTRRVQPAADTVGTVARRIVEAARSRIPQQARSQPPRRESPAGRRTHRRRHGRERRAPPEEEAEDHVSDPLARAGLTIEIYCFFDSDIEGHVYAI